MRTIVEDATAENEEMNKKNAYADAVCSVTYFLISFRIQT